MGLDMYLKASLYVSGWDQAEKARFASLIDLAGLTRNDIAMDSLSGGITLDIGYWRKANAIHNWFVQNVQGGKDECQSSSVGEDQLQDLLGVCQRVEADHGLASVLLPPAKGFFFGSTTTDEWYYHSVKDTISIVERALGPKFKGWDFEYQSSW